MNTPQTLTLIAVCLTLAIQIFNIITRPREQYWIFRRFDGDKESFALHFVEPFKTKEEAEKEIENAKYYHPKQEFIILKG